MSIDKFGRHSSQLYKKRKYYNYNSSDSENSDNDNKKYLQEEINVIAIKLEKQINIVAKLEDKIQNLNNKFSEHITSTDKNMQKAEIVITSIKNDLKNTKNDLNIIFKELKIYDKTE